MLVAANVVQTSDEDESRALLSRSKEESDKDLNTKGTAKEVSTADSQGGLSTESASKEKVHAIDKAQTDEKDKVQNQYEKDPIQASQTQCHNDVEREEDFTAKDLLGFVWQVARGMVCQVFSLSLLCDGFFSSTP